MRNVRVSKQLEVSKISEEHSPVPLPKPNQGRLYGDYHESLTVPRRPMMSYDVSHDKPSEHKNGALFVKKLSDQAEPNTSRVLSRVFER